MHEERSGWDSAIQLEPQRQCKGEESVVRVQVVVEKGHGVAGEQVLT